MERLSDPVVGYVASLGRRVGSARVLSVRGLRKTYPGDPPTEALRGVDLDIPAGSVRALIGPNGAGKTTLMSIVMGLITADDGEVALDGTVLRKPSDRDRFDIGFAPQEEALFPMLSVSENLRLFAELAGLSGGALDDELVRVSDAFLISDLRDRKTTGLSGGQRRRVHNAIALLGRPQLVILDEPTAGVDPATRSAILEVVAATADSGAAVCYSTHYLPEVAELDADVTLLDRGSVIAAGTVGELLETHAMGRIEVAFEGDPPNLSIAGRDMQVDGNRLIVRSHAPRSDVGAVMSALGEAVGTIRSVDVIEANLDDVFSNLTGRTFSAEGTG